MRLKISLSCSQLDQLPPGNLLQFVIEAMAIEIVDLPIRKNHRQTVSLPEGIYNLYWLNEYNLSIYLEYPVGQTRPTIPGMHQSASR